MEKFVQDWQFVTERTVP